MNPEGKAYTDHELDLHGRMIYSTSSLMAMLISLVDQRIKSLCIRQVQVPVADYSPFSCG